MSKLEEIKNQLASRLEKQAKSQLRTLPQNPAKKPAKEPEPKTEVSKKTEPLTNLGDRRGVVKLSVSLYDYDIVCLDKIKEYMREQGIRKLSDSEALRIACRAVETSNNFLEIHETMQKEDKRRKIS